MPSFNDTQLMAYADGELPAHEAAVLTAALAQDPSLAARVERFAASRRALKQAFALPPAAAPLSPQLARLLAAPSTATTLGRAPRRRARWPLALAASLLLGLAALIGTKRLQPPADGLSLALETTPTGEMKQTAQGEIVALSTIVAGDGSICREYERSTASDTQRGLACRESVGHWRERALVAATGSESQPEGYQLASGDGVDTAEALKGHRLTTEEERQRLASRWR